MWAHTCSSVSGNAGQGLYKRPLEGNLEMLDASVGLRARAKKRVGFPKLGEPTIMENQMEKKMENEMETVIIWGIGLLFAADLRGSSSLPSSPRHLQKASPTLILTLMLAENICAVSFGSFPLAVTAATMVNRSYSSPLVPPSLKDRFFGRGNDLRYHQKGG